MRIEYKDFTEETLPDIRELVVSRFGEGIMEAIQKILQNPLCKTNKSAGCIGYRSGTPVCFKAFMLRRLYLGQEEALGLVGGYYCKAMKGCPLPIIIEVQERSEWNRNGCRLRFGNSCIYTTMRLNERLGAYPGSASWTEMRFGVIRPMKFLLLFFRHKVLKLPQVFGEARCPTTVDEHRIFASSGEWTVCRLKGIDERLKSFWERYLAGNRGIVVSRDMETLNWLFAESIASGNCVLLALYRGKEVEGYVILRPMATSVCRWQIIDMIALENAPERLDLLLKGARIFLKRDTRAISMESTGFPEFVQPVLKKYLPHVQKTGHNRFEWITDDQDIIAEIKKSGNAQSSWFFGPFDGDYCM